MSYSLVPCWHWIVCLMSMRMEYVARGATRRLVAISFSRYSGGRFSRARPLIELASLKVRSVGSLSGLDSRASVGQWPSQVRSRRMCAWAMYPLSVSLFMVRTRCSTPNCVALSLIDGSPSPISLRGLCTLSVGNGLAHGLV